MGVDGPVRRVCELVGGGGGRERGLCAVQLDARERLPRLNALLVVSLQFAGAAVVLLRPMAMYFRNRRRIERKLSLIMLWAVKGVE